jgi:hypothetical protein
MDAFTLRVLRATYRAQIHDALSWIVDGENVAFCINCNDVFEWATADVEELTPENIDVFEQACADCWEIDEEIYAPYLFCARVRKMRPQGAAYPKGDEHKKLRALLDAAGPARSIDLLNPKAAPGL